MLSSCIVQKRLGPPVSQLKGLLLSTYMYLLITGLILIGISEFTNIDLRLADYYFDFQSRQFIWRGSWFAKQLMHVYVKEGLITFGLLVIGLTMLDLVIAIKLIAPWFRVRLRFTAIAAVIVPAVISAFKHMSVLHCPWDEQRYGGEAPYLRLFDAIPTNMEAGHCFPAGHASTGLWLAAFCVFWLPHRPRIAIAIFIAGLSVGFVLGWVQQMRGAHFLSHTLWSVWIASVIIVLMLQFSQSFLSTKCK